MRALHRFGDIIFNKCAWLKVPKHTISTNKIKLYFFIALYPDLFHGIYIKMKKLTNHDVSI